MRGNFGRDFAKIEGTYTGEKGDIKRWKDALRKVADLAGRELKDGYETKFIRQIIGEIEDKLGPRLSYVVGNLVGMHSRVANVVEHLYLGESDVRMAQRKRVGPNGLGIVTGAKTSFLVRYSTSNEPTVGIRADLRPHVGPQRALAGAGAAGEKVGIRADLRPHMGPKRALAGAGAAGEKSLAITFFQKITCRLFYIIILDDVDEKEQLEKLAGDLDWFRDRHLLLSSFLANRSLRQWKSELDRLKERPEGKIIDLLRLSYDGLLHEEKEIFLDIACFFWGKEKTHVTGVLDNCGFYSDIGMEVFVHRSLVAIKDDKLWMHDLLQEMAWEIVRQESPEEPGERSRVWLFEDGTGKVKGIVLQSGDWRTVRLNPESFTNMTNCNLKPFPPGFVPENLLELVMRDSLRRRLWRGAMVLEKLKVININRSKLFMETPDSMYVPKLERLILRGCKALSQVHPPIGMLENLIVLDWGDCENLTRLPDSVGNLKSLRVLNLSRCSNLEELPESNGGLECLEGLDVRESAITHLPSSFTFLNNLKKLCLPVIKGSRQKFWGTLTRMLRSALNSRRPRLPSFSGLSSLTELDMSGCSLLEGEIPSDIGCLSFLRFLSLAKNSFTPVPASISHISGLEFRVLYHCTNLEVLPRLPESIVFVEADNLLRQDLGLTLQQKYSLSLLRYIICCSVALFPETYVVSPCLQCGIPKWFSYQTVGHLLSKGMSPSSLDNSWRGFATCASLEQTNCNTCQDLENAHYLFCDFSADGNRLGPAFKFPFRFVNSGCISLGYVSGPRFPCDTNWQAMSNHIDVSFRITNPGLKVEKCGVHLVYDRI
ncbi:disease resistance protein RUN1-like [Rhodamnia argentea]|uniref:Disease resistance protein RUN1-like n=1 Tax=Rhodamnia argentea TaxID=178133 RepID=A0ABM3H3I9_9MYRT|nr:disease resistance protein RUN1-like [Rhodamnia argentea]